MAYPAELIRRARELRRMWQSGADRDAPARCAGERAEAQRAPWQSRHANYDRLMRSHDRLHPRHLDG